MGRGINDFKKIGIVHPFNFLIVTYSIIALWLGLSSVRGAIMIKRLYFYIKALFVRMLSPLVKYFSQLPRRLFLLDSFGAALTSFFLIIILRFYNDYFGMPASILSYLITVGLIFFSYSITCFLLLKKNWASFIRLIGLGNLLYSSFSLVLIYYYFNKLTPLGVVYFFLEAIIVVVLAIIELKVANYLTVQEKSRRF